MNGALIVSGQADLLALVPELQEAGLEISMGSMSAVIEPAA